MVQIIMKLGPKRDPELQTFAKAVLEKKLYKQTQTYIKTHKY